MRQTLETGVAVLKGFFSSCFVAVNFKDVPLLMYYLVLCNSCLENRCMKENKIKPTVYFQNPRKHSIRIEEHKGKAVFPFRF